MAKTVCAVESGVFESLGTNGSQAVVKTTSKNADGTAVKDPR